MSYTKIVVAIRAELSLPLGQKLRAREPGYASFGLLRQPLQLIEDTFDSRSSGFPRQALKKICAESDESANQIVRTRWGHPRQVPHDHGVNVSIQILLAGIIGLRRILFLGGDSLKEPGKMFDSPT